MSRLSFRALAVLGLAASTASASLLQPRAPTQVRRDEFMALKPRQTQEAGSPLYLSEPSCDSYQCANIYHPGDKMTANWLQPPPGDVQLDLLDNAKGQSVAYTVAKVPTNTGSGNCDAGAGVGVPFAGTSCGSLTWIVPSDWALGNYTMRAWNIQNPSLESYTDTILIQANTDPAKASATYAFSTIPAPGAPSSVPTATTSAPASAGTTKPTGAASSSGAPAASSTGTSTRSVSSAPAATLSGTANSAAPSSTAATTFLVGFVGAMAMGVAVLL